MNISLVRVKDNSVSILQDTAEVYYSGVRSGFPSK